MQYDDLKQWLHSYRQRDIMKMGQYKSLFNQYITNLIFAKSSAVLQFVNSDFCRLDLEKKKQCINPRGAQVANELKLICN